MKIKINKIKVGKYSIREKSDEEYLKELKESLKIDGQWNPIIIRPIENGKYELISGHYRLQAAKELGWEEIEVNVKDLQDLEANVLSMKTNLIRMEMSPREQGKVLHKIITEYGITQNELAKKIGMSQSKISQLLTIVLKLDKSVVEALNSKKINYGIASIIGSLSIEQQSKFLKIILDRKISSPALATQIKNKYLNDTIYTIGYQGRNLQNFIEILKKNEIKLVVDVRSSAKSEKKPEFNEEILKRELERNYIKYKHFPELGIPFLLQEPYKNGKFSYDCLKQWYNWHIEEKVELEEIIKFLKDSGRSATMCMERYAKPMKEQKYACHRDILANLILNFNVTDPLLVFNKRKDL